MRQFPLLGIIFSLYGLLCLTLVLFLPSFQLVHTLPTIAKPDFAKIEDTQQRKQVFFDFLTPMIEDQNKNITHVRNRLVSIQESYESSGKFSRRSTRYIDNLTVTYRFDDEELTTEERLTTLLRRVDTIPIAMILAQSASESGWGSSRFARIANNFFGQWCYKKGCGIVPNKRIDGANHEVAKFSNVRKSVNSYFLNINTHFAYKDFRLRRQELRDEGKIVRSADLIPTLIKYSERGEDYLNDLYQIIRINKLNAIEDNLIDS